MLDQAASSLQNFTILFAGMRWLDLDTLGVFALVYALMTLALTATRSLVLEPYLVRSTATPDLVRAGGRAAGACALVSAVLAAASVLAALVGPDSFRSSLLAAAVVLPFVLIQDSYRYVLFAQGRQLSAGVNDSVGLLVSLAAIIGLGVARHHGTAYLLGAWGLGCLAGVAVGFAQTRMVPAPRSGRQWLREHGDLGWPLAGSTAAQQGTGRLSQMLISGLAGTAALGAISASRTLLTPMTTLLTASMSFSVPEGVRWHAKGPAALDRFVRSTSLVLSAVVVVYCLAFLVVPTSWGTAVVGANWTSAISLLVPTGLWVLGMTASQGPRVGLRVLGRGRETLRVSLVIGVLLLVACVVGAVLGGATGAAWGFGIVSMIGQLLWWTAYRAARRVEVPS